ncbi:MAG: protein O-mannosyl-transferase family [Microgenomates group bacterium]
MDKQIWMGKFLILTLVIPFLIYLKTLLPTVGFWDTGEFQTVAYTLDVAHPTGYPTYIVLGKLFISIFPFGNIAWRMNLLSAIFVSIGIFIFSLLIKRATNNNLIAILSSILLSINPYLWSIAIRADPHALHFLFASLFLFLSYEVINQKSLKHFFSLSLITGLSLGNHMLSIFFIPSLILIGVYLIKTEGIKKSYKQIVFSILLFCLGLLIYIFIPIISSTRPPLVVDYSLSTFEGFKKHVFGQDYQGLMKTWARGNPKDTFIFYFSLIKESFPFYSWILVVSGMIISTIKRGVYGFVLFTTFVLTLLFSLTYQNSAIERYFITSFTIGVFWLSEFVNFIYSKVKNRFIIVPVIFYLVLMSVFILKDNYKKIDQSKNFYAHEWATQTISNVGNGGVIYSWWSYSTPLWYIQKVEGERKDIEIINAGTEKWEILGEPQIELKRVYFTQKVDLRNKDYYLLPTGNIYELRRF